MLIKQCPNGLDRPYPSEITPRAVFESRRSFLKQVAAGSIAGGALLEMAAREAFAQGSSGPKLAAKSNPAYVVMDKTSAYKDATTYNNFYEFGTDKSDPAQYAHTLKTRPWTVTIDGEIGKPMTLDLDALRRGLVDGDSMDRLFAIEPDQKGRAERHCALH